MVSIPGGVANYVAHTFYRKLIVFISFNVPLFLLASLSQCLSSFLWLVLDVFRTFFLSFDIYIFMSVPLFLFCIFPSLCVCGCQCLSSIG